MRSVVAVVCSGLIAGTALFAFAQYIPAAIVFVATTLAAYALALRG